MQHLEQLVLEEQLLLEQLLLKQLLLEQQQDSAKKLSVLWQQYHDLVKHQAATSRGLSLAKWS